MVVYMCKNSDSVKKTPSNTGVFKIKINSDQKNSIILLAVIGLAGLFVRLYYLPYNLPIALDGLNYFWYAIDLSILGHFPTTYAFPNNGWSTFLSIFFYFFHSDNFLDYMNLQRLLSVILSTLTIIPTYLLCNRFFKNYYAIIGATIFAFEPRLVQNSLLGLPESLFVLLGTTALFLFLSNSYKIIYVAFAATALFALIRYEGILLMIPFSLIFFMRFRKQKKVVLKYLLAMSIFLIILLPMMHIRTETIGHDGLVNNVVAVPQYYQTVSQQSENRYNTLFNIIETGFINLVKYLGWVMIPSFLIFVPYGAIMIFKNRDYKNITMILTIIVLLLPAFYAYSRNIQETKYLFVLFPMFCVLSCFTVEKLNKKFNKPNMLVGILLSGIILSSLVFLDFKKIDYELEMEVFNTSKEIVKKVSVVNNYYPETRYLDSAILVDVPFPILRESSPKDVKIIKTTNFNSLEDFIDFGKEQNLTHIVIDEKENRPLFLRDVFYNEPKYPYLTKIYDSRENGFSYHLKVFKIDYEEFNSFKNK